MKVVSPGTLIFNGEHLIVSGWHFDSEGEMFPTENAMHKAMASAALNYVAVSRGLQLKAHAPEAETFPLDIERQAANIIGGLRQAKPAERRASWKFWK